jgi:L-amino acid N-acyltransferase YncA
MVIRNATPHDARRIAVIHVDSWRAAYRGIMPDTVLNGLSVDERYEFWLGQLAVAARQTIVAENGDGIIGWAGFGASRDADAAGLAEVYGIYLDPLRYRKGFGTALWLDAGRRLAAQGYRELIVWVLSANSPARKFYEAMGGWMEPGVEKVLTREGVRLQEVRYRCPCG